MTKTDAHIIARLEAEGKNEHLQPMVRAICRDAAARMAELVVENEQLIRQGSDKG